MVVPVSDVDRAKGFYEGLGWRLDADLAVEDGYRVVQLTPPGSGCSIIFGEGVTAAPPGSAEGLQLAVYDIDEARADLIARGVEVSETFHDVTGIFHHAGTEGRVTARPRSTPTTARSPPSATRTATAGCCRRSRPGCRAAEGTMAPDGAEVGDEQRLRRDRARRRLAGRALRGRAGRGRPARRRRRARARGRGVLVLGLHPVEDAAAARRGGPRGARGRRDRRGRCRGGARLARLHGLRPLRRRTGALAGRQRDRPAARQRPARRPGRRRGRRRAPHRRPRGPRQRRRPGRAAGARACASSTASGPTARRPR